MELKMKTGVCLVCLVALATTFMAVPAFSSDKSSIESAYSAWRNALDSRNAEQIVGLYDEKGVLLATFEAEPLVGHDRIRPYFIGLVKLPKLSVKPQTSIIRIFGDTAVNSGTYEFSYEKDGKVISVPARFSFTYAKGPSGWKIVDHHSSVLPTK